MLKPTPDIWFGDSDIRDGTPRTFFGQLRGSQLTFTAVGFARVDTVIQGRRIKNKLLGPASRTERLHLQVRISRTWRNHGILHQPVQRATAAKGHGHPPSQQGTNRAHQNR